MDVLKAIQWFRKCLAPEPAATPASQSVRKPTFTLTLLPPLIAGEAAAYH